MENIICERRIYDSRFNTHSHLYGQLILPIKGNLYIETDYKKIELDHKLLFFLPPDCKHIFKAKENNEFLTLDINKQILNMNDMKNLYGGKEFKFDDKWKAVRYLLLNECKGGKSSKGVNDLFNYCSNLIFDDIKSESVKYIEDHYTENINLKTLADIEHYNTNYYSEWFKNKMNMKVTEYIKSLRIEKAKEYLLNTDLSVLEIAKMIGYEHNSSFTRAFKECENISPAEFRKRI